MTSDEADLEHEHPVMRSPRRHQRFIADRGLRHENVQRVMGRLVQPVLTPADHVDQRRRHRRVDVGRGQRVLLEGSRPAF